MKQINEDIKNGQLKSAYLLYGKEDYLKRQYRDKLVNAVTTFDDTMNLNRFAGDKINVNEVIDLADTLPFFAERRVILVENSGFFKSSQERLASYMEHLPESLLFIFVENEIDKRNKLYKNLDKFGYASEFNHPDPAVLAKWAGGKLNANGLKIEREAWQEFLQRTNTNDEANMQYIDNELSKLMDFCYGKEVITLDDVKAITSGYAEGKIFDLMDAIATKNAPLTMQLYRDMLEAKEAPLKILSMIEREFRQLLVIKTMADDHIDINSIASALGSRDWAVRRKLNVASRLSEAEIKAALAEATALDYDIKIGNINDSMAVEIMLLKYSK